MMGRVLDLDPAGGILAFRSMLRGLIAMPGRFMDDGRDPDLVDHFAIVAQRTNVYTIRDYASIIEHLVKTWNIAGRTVTGTPAQAQDDLCRQAERYARLAERASARLEKQRPVGGHTVQALLIQWSVKKKWKPFASSPHHVTTTTPRLASQNPTTAGQIAWIPWHDHQLGISMGIARGSSTCLLEWVGSCVRHTTGTSRETRRWRSSTARPTRLRREPCSIERRRVAAWSASVGHAIATARRPCELKINAGPATSKIAALVAVVAVAGVSRFKRCSLSCAFSDSRARCSQGACSR
jgi:hypothetical protein